jgi:hypothetical protein
LEIRLAVVCIIAPTAGQIAAGTIARKELDLIGIRWDWADDDFEHPLAVKIGL